MRKLDRTFHFDVRLLQEFLPRAQTSRLDVDGKVDVRAST
jgi:hypothetical protein